MVWIMSMNLSHNLSLNMLFMVPSPMNSVNSFYLLTLCFISSHCVSFFILSFSHCLSFLYVFANLGVILPLFLAFHLSIYERSFFSSSSRWLSSPIVDLSGIQKLVSSLKGDFANYFGKYWFFFMFNCDEMKWQVLGRGTEF